MRSRRVERRSARNGLTVIELLVTLTIIGIMMALLIPAISAARATSQRMQCQNNLRNLGLAILHGAEQAQRFQAAGNFGGEQPGVFHSWVVDILPWIDQRTLYDQWRFDQPSISGPNATLAKTEIPLLVCPSDQSLMGAGDLTYVVNGGFGYTSISPKGVGDCPVTIEEKPIDFNGNGVTCPLNPKLDGTPDDKVVYLQTGFFFMQNWPITSPPSGTYRFHRMQHIFDGLSQTLMLSENVRAGRNPSQTAENSTWAAPYGYGNSFYLSWHVCANLNCGPGKVDYALANQGNHAINSSLTQAEWAAPWISSYHTGGVNVVFGDGHVTFLSQNVAGAVYAALMSPQGGRLVGPLAQQPLSADDY